MGEYRNTIDSGTHGSVVTAASTSAAGTQLGIGGTGTVLVTWDSDVKIGGDASIKIQPVASSQSRYVELAANDGSTQASMVGYFRLTAHPTNGAQVVAQITPANGGSSLATCEVSPDGTVRFRSMGSDVGAASTAKVAAGPWYRIELAVKTGASGSSLVSGKISQGTSTTALHSASSTSVNMPNLTIGAARLGFCISGAQSNDFEQHVDCFRLATGSSTLLGPWLGEPDPATVNPDSIQDPGAALGLLADQTVEALNAKANKAAVVTQVRVNGVTKTPTNGLLDLGTISGGTGGGAVVSDVDFASIITN